MSLEGLSGVDQTQLTSTEVHQDQAATNSWYISTFTLRLLRHVEAMISRLSTRASSVTVPTLILHGGRDVFSDPSDIERFANQFPPQARVERRYYPESHHLLFYDHEREEVLRDTTTWLRKLHPPGEN